MMPKRLSEAYSLFIAKRFSDSEKLLDGEDDWLEEYIKNYFATVDHFSYSSIKTNPYEFLTKNIISMPYVGAATDFGSNVHDALDDILKGKSKIGDFKGEVARGVKNGLDAIEELKKEYPGLQIDSTEKHIKVLLSSLTDYNEDNIQFTGYIDAVFKHDDGYLIVDYKTDKKSNYASEHKRQLAVYKKMLANIENVPEENISTYVIFVTLRDNINTGKFETEISKGTRDVFPTFETHLKKVLEWKKDPNKFIAALLEGKNDEPLYLAVKEKLTKSSS